VQNSESLMADLTLIDAWSSWSSGNTIGDDTLWGVKILWWGRIGKIVMALSALTIIAEIVGPERIRAVGKALRGTFRFRDTPQHLKDALRWTKLMWKDLFSLPGSKREEEARSQPNRMRADDLNFILTHAVGLCVGLIIWTINGSWWKAIVFGFSATAGSFFTVGPILTTLAVVLLFTVAKVIDGVLIQPLAWALDREDVAMLTKIASVILLMIGFHFDLLAS
jgi:hypothetical protein